MGLCQVPKVRDSPGQKSEICNTNQTPPNLLFPHYASILKMFIGDDNKNNVFDSTLQHVDSKCENDIGSDAVVEKMTIGEGFLLISRLRDKSQAEI